MTTTPRAALSAADQEAAIALAQRMARTAGKCKRKTGLNGEPCDLMPPCPDCGLSCHDVAEGG